MPTTLAAYAPERHGDPYAGFEPRIVPENVTLLPKTTAQVTGGNAWNERTIALKKGDSVSAILREMGATADEMKAITAAFGGRGKDSSPRDGYKLRVLLAPASDGRRLRPVRVIIATDTSSRGDGGVVGAGQIRRRRRAQRQQRGVLQRTTTRTTARACGSIRASTRPRYATTCPAP